MLAYFLAAVIAITTVEGCVVTDYKPFGAACNCSDACLGNSHCQHDGQGGFACLCLICQYYDSTYGQCVDIPGYGQPCSSQCGANFVCAGVDPGPNTCQCPAGASYDGSTQTCIQATDCVNNTDNGCAGLPNGDYPACYPECQEGIFITCSNTYRYVRDCALGWYVRPSGERFTEKLVYDPTVKRCERKASYCPRSLDSLVEV